MPKGKQSKCLCRQSRKGYTINTKTHDLEFNLNTSSSFIKHQKLTMKECEKSLRDYVPNYYYTHFLKLNEIKKNVIFKLMSDCIENKTNYNITDLLIIHD